MSFGSRPLGGFGTQSTLTNSSLLSGSTTQAPAAGTLQDLQNDITIPDGPEDSISDLSFSPVSDFISVASWDKKNRIYEVNARTGSVEGRALYEHEGPILSTRWSFNGTKVISGGADKQIKIFDLQSQQHQTVGIHNEPVKSVRYVTCGASNTECIVSGSWDKTIKYWDMRQQNSICTLNMPERVYAMDASQKLLVVATAERHVVIINLNSPDKFFRQSMSPLKYQTRSISCYPKGDGFAIGSIEGRCGIQYVDEMQQKQFGFSFKCQRDQKTTTKETLIYSLNSIAFHPVHGTFVTAGADGTFNFWDKDAKHRLKGYPSLNATIPVVGFNASGSIFAYALSYDWSKGHEYNAPNYPNIVRLHACKDEEVKQRQKRK